MRVRRLNAWLLRVLLLGVLRLRVLWLSVLRCRGGRTVLIGGICLVRLVLGRGRGIIGAGRGVGGDRGGAGAGPGGALIDLRSRVSGVGGVLAADDQIALLVLLLDGHRLRRILIAWRGQLIILRLVVLRLVILRLVILGCSG